MSLNFLGSNYDMPVSSTLGSEGHTTAWPLVLTLLTLTVIVVYWSLCILFVIFYEKNLKIDGERTTYFTNSQKL